MIHRYKDYRDYCDSSSYQRWLSTWQEPSTTKIQNWVDFELDHNTPRGRLTRVSTGTRLPYHLLDSLGMSGKCVDIGCGHNFFKLTYDIWGVDPEFETHRDDELKSEWWVENWGKWSHAFSCNAMHFCDQDGLPNQIAKVRGILAQGGTAVVAINRQRVAERTSSYDVDKLYDTLCNTPGLTRMVWIEEPLDAVMDGNVWIWLTK